MIPNSNPLYHIVPNCQSVIFFEATHTRCERLRFPVNPEMYRGGAEFYGLLLSSKNST